MALKAGFNPDQPRDKLGMWSDGGGAGVGGESVSGDNQVVAVFADLASFPLAIRIGELFAESSTSESEAALQTIAAEITYSNAVTGDEGIDSATERLSNTLRSVMSVFEPIPSSMPGVYGTAVHSAFGRAVRAQGLEGVDVEI